MVYNREFLFSGVRFTSYHSKAVLLSVVRSRPLSAAPGRLQEGGAQVLIVALPYEKRAADRFTHTHTKKKTVAAPRASKSAVAVEGVQEGSGSLKRRGSRCPMG